MKILLIEDNKDIAGMVSLCLESQNIECKTILDGKAGLEAARKGDFDAILLDVAMPEFSGFDVFRALKNENLLDSKNILIFTASSVSGDDVEKMLSSGAKGVLRKPLSIDDLIEAVERFRKDAN